MITALTTIDMLSLAFLRHVNAASNAGHFRPWGREYLVFTYASVLHLAHA